ncbi:MAG TPA: SDR family NAD(P)-dependent oxidoreductase, partial [Methylomirabilota bacterium]
MITGAASGIGRALAEGLAREGARLVLADVDEAGLQAACAALAARGTAAVAVRTDVSERGQVLALADRAWDAFGAVHILSNNAGVSTWGGLEAASHRDWQWVLGVNLWGV